MKYVFILIVGFVFFASCINHDIVDCDYSDLSVELIRVDSATDCGTPDGKIQLKATGGKPPYSYILNGTIYFDETITDLAAGIYFIQVQDGKGCTDTIANVMLMAKDAVYEANIEADTECLTDNGSIVVEVTQGDPPYTYQLGDGGFSAVNSFVNLSSGNYRIAVKDNNDCQIILNITVPREQTGVSWTTDIRPLLEANCAIDNCHNGTDRSNDFSDYADVKFYANQIKANTQDRSMPFDATLTQGQIDLIACWVDDGAIKN